MPSEDHSSDRLTRRPRPCYRRLRSEEAALRGGRVDEGARVSAAVSVDASVGRSAAQQAEKRAGPAWGSHGDHRL